MNLTDNSIQKKAHFLKKKTHGVFTLIRPFVPGWIEGKNGRKGRIREKSNNLGRKPEPAHHVVEGLTSLKYSESGQRLYH